ncbi:MAG: 16S rRNA (cytosine(967)-C(5))-methyltransferase RsmB [Pseudomonadota bacterium]
MSASGTLTRRLAAQIITSVAKEGRSLNELLNQEFPKLSAKDIAFLKQLCFGVIRYYDSLNAIYQQWVNKSLKAKDSDVKNLLLVGIYQLLYLRTPEHAAINSTVNAATALKKPWAKGFINGTLRNVLRQLSEAQALAHSQSNHPTWLQNLLQKQYPETFTQIFEQNNRPAPMAIRVNTRKITPSEYGDLLRAENIDFRMAEVGQSGIILEHPIDVTHLPGFRDGLCSVQDVSAQQCAELLDLSPGLRVLDACAAPGGKTGHIAELCDNNVSLVALEKDAKRIGKIDDNLSRLNLQAQVICDDATQTQSWWNGQTFDRILLDVPCSATGVIRRHPDIKLLRKAEDIAQLVEQQKAILSRCWPMLEPGGLLLYSTCSLLQQENQQQIAEFLSCHTDAESQILHIGEHQGDKFGLSIQPGTHDMDGFFYALLKKCKSE